MWSFPWKKLLTLTCGHCLFTLTPLFNYFFNVGQIDFSPGELMTGESTFGRKDLLRSSPCECFNFFFILLMRVFTEDPMFVITRPTCCRSCSKHFKQCKCLWHVECYLCWYLTINCECGWVSYEELWRARRVWITPSEISIILHMIRKPNSIIVVLFIQNNS